MFEALKKLLGMKQGEDLATVIARGATIVDVRTSGEYNTGHLRKSVNIPLQELQSRLGKLDKNKPVVTCCASGMRSSSAKSILKSKGFSEVYNGGSWHSLKKYE
jgi:phage shock protein E